MRFNHLNIPDQWQHYWTKYPEGYTILEALISWVAQVDSMIDNQNSLNQNIEAYRKELDDFVGKFDKDLQSTVSSILSEWQNSGLLDVIISEALQTQLDKVENSEKEKGYNIQWNALEALDGDWTRAIQLALDNHTHVFIPPGTFRHTGLTVTRNGATLSGSGQLYGGSALEYAGTGKAITATAAVGYLQMNNLRVKGLPAISTDYYNAASVGIDITAGNTAIVADKLWVDGFQTLIMSNYNSFYNKFLNCRFEKALTCLDKFSNNNMYVNGCRFVRFNVAIKANGTNGPLTVVGNSFEVFNGEIIVGTGEEKGLVIFKNNYVEIYDNADLPTNFPDKLATGAKVGKFGGNILFTGYFGTLVIRENEIQLGGAFRLMSLAGIDVLESVDNNIHLYSSGNNLDKLYFIPTAKSVQINDRLGKDQGVGTYTRTYTPYALNVDTPYRPYYYFDCVADKEFLCPQKILTPALLNGWTQSTDPSYGVPKAIITKEGIRLSGSVDGTNSTAIVLFNLAAANRPFAHGTSKGYANLITATDFGAGEKIRLRYLYTTGDVRIEGAPTSKKDISLDGLFIPLQT